MHHLHGIAFARSPRGHRTCLDHAHVLYLGSGSCPCHVPGSGLHRGHGHDHDGHGQSNL